jgi:3-deoxy-D-manno-octulosonic acid (KDO) 8-phosphate synthase
VSPHDIRHAAEKVASTGNAQVVFDATHSVQLPGGAAPASAGQPEFIRPLAGAAVAVSVNGVFVETHDAPENALSDGANSLRLDRPLLAAQRHDRIDLRRPPRRNVARHHPDRR